MPASPLMPSILVGLWRDGRWQFAELCTFSDAEFEALAARTDHDDGWVTAIQLAKWIRDHSPTHPALGGALEEPGDACP